MKFRSPALPLWHLGAQSAVPDGPFVALVPGEAAPLFPLDLPDTKRESVRRQIARAQLESLLQSGTEGLDIRVGMLGDGGAAVVADTARAAEWRRRLAPAAQHVRALLPDYMAVPAAPDGWAITVRTADDLPPSLLVRLGPGDGFTAPLPVALRQLEAALRERERPENVHLSGPVPEALTAFLETRELRWTEAGPEGPAAPGPEELAFSLHRDPEADLREAARTVRRWRAPMLLLLAGLVALALGLRIDTRRLEEAAAARNAEAVAVARAAFLPAGPILNLRTQVGRVISERAAAADASGRVSGPVDLLHAAAATLARETVPVRRIQLSGGGRLRLTVSVPDFASLERLTDLLDAPPVRARVLTSAAEADADVTAEIELAAAEAP